MGLLVDRQGIDGAMLAQRVAEATGAATQAAQAALALATSTSSSSKKSGDDSYKLLPKPNSWAPKDREAELSSFRDWSWPLEKYLVTIDAEYERDLELIRQDPNKAIEMTSMDEQERKRTMF